MHAMLGMHMANELLSVPVAAVTLLTAGVAVGLAARRSAKSLGADKMPLMGVMGAFVFAGQMINFALPLMPGTSGHLGGGVLLAILLGPASAIVTMTAILIVQCLLFQDGGLLALGCNVINIGIVPCLLGWATYRMILGDGRAAPAWRQYIGAWAACMIGVVAGASLVPIQAGVSGVLRIPMGQFLAVMAGVHLLIGFVEGAVTFAVLAYLRRASPLLLGLEAPVGAERLGRGAVLASVAITALLLAGVVSWFASTHPDGLEWSYRGRSRGQGGDAVGPPSGAAAAVDRWQARWSLMADYAKRPVPLGQTPAEAERQDAAAETWPNVDGWGSLAGLAGTLATLGVVYLAAALMRRRFTRPTAPG
jgi:cobalt/nickel transport system permease protein